MIRRPANDDSATGGLLIAKKVGKKIGVGERVTLQVRDADGSITPEFPFSRLE